MKKLSICPDVKLNRLGLSLRRKIIMRIKLIFFIALSTLLQVSANSFGQKITINQTNISLEKALKLIRQQSNYDVLFEANVIRKQSGINIHVNNGTLADALRQCLTGTGFTYKIEEKTILIKEKSIIEELGEKIANQFQDNRVRGLVTSINSLEGLPGATVMVKRTKKAVYTDSYGRFEIKDVLPKDTLVCSFIGYVTKYYPVGKEREFFIRMEETTNALDVVVVQAYGKTTKRLATGNIVSVTADDIEKQTISNPLLALQGLVPGLEIKAQNGNQLSVPKVELRGRSAINSNFTSEPLYIVDGVPLTVLGNRFTGAGTSNQGAISSGLDQNMLAGGISPLYNINPADIASIEVLKDADATAIYGSRGGNGVILITTKKGHVGKTKFSAGLKQGVQVVIAKWDMLNTEQYLEMRREALKNDGITPTAANAPELMVYDQNRYTDWQEYTWGNTGKWTDFNAGLSGGDANTNFRISTGLNSTRDITTSSGKNQRLSFASNLSHKSKNQRFDLNLSAQFSAANSNVRGLLGNIARLAPNAPDVYKENGELNFDAWKTDMQEFTSMKKSSDLKTNLLNAGLNLGYTALKNLSFRLNLGYNSSGSEVRLTTPLSSFGPLAVNPTSYINWGTTAAKNIIVEPQVEYNAFIGKGSLNVLTGATVQHNSTTSISIRARGFLSDDQLTSMNSAAEFNSEEKIRQYKYAGIFARLSYNWENKYILNLNARRDGSSRFGAANRFGNFGSIGASWIASEESWLKDRLPKAISFIKFRGSYGILGSDGVGDYQYLTQWGSESPSGKLYPYEGVSPVIPQIQPNADFRWQRNSKSELAMELAFFKDLVSLDVVWYSNYCDNQLLNFPIPSYSGFSTVVLNSPAEVRNSGLELSLSARVVNTKTIGWTTSINFSKNKNILVGYPRLEESPYYSAYKIGQSLNNTYVFKNTGVDPQTGNYTYYDYNGDGEIKYLNNVPVGTMGDDRGLAINTAPDFFGGWSNSFRFNKFMLSARFYYVKQKGRMSFGSSGNSNSSLYQYENSWHKPGDQAIYSKYTTQENQLNNFAATSDLMFVDADFFRLRDLNLGYSLPADKLKFLGITSLSLNVNVTNLFVITNYKGMDPEIQEFGNMPSSRTLTMGFNCSF